MTSPRRVLVVDDDPAVREVARRLLERGGWEVLCVPGVEEACNALVAADFSVVLCDIVFGEHSGWEVLALARQRGRPPVVMMSVVSNVETVKDALVLGAKAFLAKPLSADALFSALD